MKSTHPQLSPAEQAEIIVSLCEKLKAVHVFPELAERLCDSLEGHLAAGDYHGLHEGEFFALALRTHFQEVTRDEHLWVRWSEEPLPDDPGSLRQNPEWLAQRRKEAEAENFGFGKVAVLEGNVGSIEMLCFHPLEWARDTVAAAMAAVSDTDALIFDLRGCPGGSPETVTFLSSYLFDERPVFLGGTYLRAEEITEEYWTLKEVPGKRYLEKLVYVLIGKGTFSGGEAFAYNLQAQGRATLVGEQTDGGAHLASLYRLHPHMEASIPVGRAVNPVTGTNWQGIGVMPDVAVPVEDAFEEAYRLARETSL
jgi:C-terminal processing protease CtpA/Prc